MIPDDQRSNRSQPAGFWFLALLIAFFGGSNPGAVTAFAKNNGAATDEGPQPDEFPQPVEAERTAAEAVRKLGGWYALDEEKHVIEVNMVYYYEPSGRRHDNSQTTDKVLKHLPDF